MPRVLAKSIYHKTSMPTNWELDIERRIVEMFYEIHNKIMEMENTWISRAIGTTLDYLYSYYGIILADIHLNNIGLVKRMEVPVITDPGHMIRL